MALPVDVWTEVLYNLSLRDMSSANIVCKSLFSAWKQWLNRPGNIYHHINRKFWLTIERARLPPVAAGKVGEITTIAAGPFAECRTVVAMLDHYEKTKEPSTAIVQSIVKAMCYVDPSLVGTVICDKCEGYSVMGRNKKCSMPCHICESSWRLQSSKKSDQELRKYYGNVDVFSMETTAEKNIPLIVWPKIEIMRIPTDVCVSTYSKVSYIRQNIEEGTSSLIVGDFYKDLSTPETVKALWNKQLTCCRQFYQQELAAIADNIYFVDESYFFHRIVDDFTAQRSQFSTLVQSHLESCARMMLYSLHLHNFDDAWTLLQDFQQSLTTYCLSPLNICQSNCTVWLVVEGEEE